MEANKVILSLEEYNRLRDNEREHLEIISSLQNKGNYLENNLKAELKLSRDMLRRAKTVHEDYIDYHVATETIKIKSKSILQLIKWKYKK